MFGSLGDVNLSLDPGGRRHESRRRGVCTLGVGAMTPRRYESRRQDVLARRCES
jgi:hypothetical protein